MMLRKSSRGRWCLCRLSAWLIPRRRPCGHIGTCLKASIKLVDSMIETQQREAQCLATMSEKPLVEINRATLQGLHELRATLADLHGVYECGESFFE